MANLTINSTPPAIVLAGNGIKYNVSTANALLGEAIKAKLQISFITEGVVDWEDIAEGETIQINFNGISLEFTFDDNPDESGLQLPTPTNNVLYYYSIALRNALMQNYYIARDWELLDSDINNVIFHLQAREAYWYDCYISTNATNKLSVATLQVGQQTAYRSNYKLCGMFIANNVFAIEEKYPFPNLDIDFDFADYVKHLCECDFTLNPTTTIVAHPNAIVPFNVKFFEKYAASSSAKIIPNILYPDQTRYALPGGIDKTSIHNYEADDTDVISDFIENKKFLTHADDGMKLKFDDIMRLFFLVQTTNALAVRVARYNADGYQIGSWITSLNPQAYDNNSIIEIIADPLKIFTETQLETSYFIEIKLYDTVAHEDISAVRKYYIDNTLSSQRLQFVFANSFEVAFDTIFAYGKAEHNIDIENYTLLNIDKSTSQSRSERIENLIIRSGFLTFRQLFYWQEFIQSNKRYLIRDGRRIPVRVLSTNIFMYKNQNYNFGIELELEIDDKDKYRSTLPSQDLAFSDYFNSYGYSFAIAASIAGHIILDPDGNEMNQRSKLQITGHNVSASDNESEDKTVFNIAHTGFWFELALSLITTTPDSTNTILTEEDLSDSLHVGNILEIVQSTTTSEHTITDIDDTTITVTPATLNTTTIISSLKVKTLAGPTISSKEFTIEPGDWLETWEGDFGKNITVPGVNIISMVIVAPAGISDTNEDNYAAARIKGSTQGTNVIQIRATTKPTENINIQITYLWQ